MKKNILSSARKAIFAAVFFLLFSFSAQAQLSTKGKDFWFGFSENYSTPTLTVYISSDIATSGTISVPLGSFTQNFNIAANSGVSIIVPIAEAYNTGSDNIMPKGIHVVAQNPVSVYALNSITYSSDASGVLPTSSLGTNYRVAGARANVYASEFLIAAAQNNTIVTITPTVNTVGGHYANIPYTVELNQGETYQVQSNWGENLNGSLVISSNPIALFSGAICTNIGGCSYCDHIFEQNMPTKRLGQRFILVPLARKRAPIVYDIVATENATQIFRNGNIISTINAGQTYNFSTSEREVVTASAPVAVMQYCPGSACDGVASDPFSVYVPPVDQMIDKITFNAFDTPNIPSYFVNITTATSNIGNVRLDGNAVVGFSPIPFDPTISAVILSGLSRGTHNLDAGLNGRLSAMVYGYGSDDSYGYLAGTSTAALRGSDIIADPDFYYNQNIPYIDYLGNNVDLYNSVAVARFIVRDGGASAPDADDMPTTLTDLTIHVSHPGMVNRLAIYYTEHGKIAEMPVPADGNVHFSNLNDIIASDDYDTVFELRATFTTNVIDNTQIIYSITSAIAAADGTEFKDPDAGGAATSTEGDDNRIEVIADHLRFAQQPTDVYTGAVMQPDVIVQAVDEYHNIDLDLENTEVNLSNSYLTDSPISALLSGQGIALYGTLTFTTPAANQTLYAEAYIYQGEGSYTISGTSDPFNILGDNQTFSPIVHLIASDVNQANGSLVQLWPDATDAGSDDHATQNSASMQPSYCNTGDCLINGYPIVQFNAGKGMGIAARDAINGGDGKTIFVVFRTSSNATNKQMLVEIGGEPSGFNMYIDNLRLYAGAWDSRRWWINRILSTNRTYLAQFVYDGSSLRLSLSNEGVTSTTSTLNNQYIDPFITPNTHNGGIGATLDQTRYHNGMNMNSGYSDFFRGRMAEVYIINTADVNIRTQIFDYLNQKYNIQAGAQPFTKETDKFVFEGDSQSSLLQFAPNPATGFTEATFTLPNGGSYRLSLQNTLGMTVSVIDEGNHLPGNYTVQFNTSEFPSGIYQAVLASQNGTITIPVVIER